MRRLLPLIALLAGLAAHAQLPNPGFEAGLAVSQPPAGWTLKTNLLPEKWACSAQTPGVAGLVEEAHTGRYALFLSAVGTAVHCHADMMSVQRGDTYEFSAWAKSGQVSLVFYEYKGDKWLRATPLVAGIRAGDTWAQGGGYYTVPGGVDQVAAVLSVDTPSGVLIDDLGLHKVTLPKATGPDLTFENEGLRLVIGPRGECRSLWDKTLRAERSRPSGRPLMQAVAGNWTLPATSCAAQGNRLNVVFGDNQARAVIEVQTHPNFLGFVIRSYWPDNLEQLTLLDLLVTKQETVGASCGLMYDRRAALGLQTLHFSGQQTFAASGPDQIRLGCTYNRLARDRKALYRPPMARGCALLACPRAKLPATLQAIEKAYGLPASRIEGVWAKLSPAMRRSYLFVTDLTATNVDKVIAYAKRGHFDYVLLAQDSWSHGGGTFAINEKAFPGGLPSLKTTVGKLQQAGLKVGLHLLTAGMDPTDPLVTPVPDQGIYSNGTVPLAADLDATATFIPTASPPPAEFPENDIPYPGQGAVLWIGDELVRYGQRKLEPPYGFTSCQRGLWGTKAAAHSSGTPIKHLYMMVYGLVLMDADSDLIERVSQRVADVMNACHCDGVYFDGSELLQGDHDYYNARLQTAYLDKITRKDLIVQGSSYSPYTWHSMCRMASADGFRQIKLWLDRRTPTFQWYFDTLMPLDIGWYAINANIRPDDLEYVCSRAVGYGSGISVQTNTQALDTVPQAHEMIDLIGRWEDLRRSGRVPEALREQMRQPGHEFRLTRRGKEDVVVPIEYSAWAASPTLLLPEQVPAGDRDPLRPPDDVASTLTLANKRGQPAETELQIECGELVRPGPSYAAGVPLELFESVPASPILHGEQATREGVTQAITLVTDEVKEGQSACRFSATSTLPETGGWAAFGKAFDPPLSLQDYAAIGLWVKGDAQCELLKVQLWDAAGRAQDELIPIGFSGWRYLELPRPTGLAMDYEHIVKLCFYYNGMPGNSTCTTIIDGVKVLSRGTTMENPTLIVNGQPITFPTGMVQGDRLVLNSNGESWLYRTGGQERQRVTPQGNPGALTGEVTVAAQEATHQLRFRGARLWPTLGTVLPGQ